MKWWKRIKNRKLNEMTRSLTHARDLWGIDPACVVDIGAAQGKWSLRCADVWPAANYVLVEPLKENGPPIAELIASRPGWRHVAAAAGAEAGEIVFSVAAELDSSGVYEGGGFERRNVPVVALDSLDYTIGDCVLKLDTHGYEVPILEGATGLLKRTTLLIVEVYGQRITSRSLLFHEMCGYLVEHGFQVADIVDVTRRPADRSFWQADFFFLRAEHPVFSDHAFH
jgi:FkbM family methyltransferase